MQQLPESDVPFVQRISNLRDAMTFGCRREEMHTDIEVALSVLDGGDSGNVAGLQAGHALGRQVSEGAARQLRAPSLLFGKSGDSIPPIAG